MSLDSVQAQEPGDVDVESKTWRAASARVAHEQATTTEQFVDQTRRAGVRDAISVLRGAHHFAHFPAAERQRVIFHALAASVEKQARVSGLGRITIPIGGTA